MRNAILHAFVLVALLILGPVVAAHSQVTDPSPTSQYLILLRPAAHLIEASNWTDADNQAVAAHFKRLKRLTEEGRVVLAGRTLNEDDSQFGIVIVEAASEAQAREIMDEDPAVKAGVMTAQLFPYRIALMRAAGGSRP